MIFTFMGYLKVINHIFMDSFAWIAIINKSDNYHKPSLKLLNDMLSQQTELVTTNYILIETINALSKAEYRKAIIEFINRIEKSPSVTVIKITDEIHKTAWKLYQQRMDKDWGITDCTSFEVMNLVNIKRAFTNDKHFEQAGYTILI